ncbi:Protein DETOXIFICATION 42 [Camellia lanceoleosa]|uniref:Protein DETOXIFICATION 42 n=1 Tax=Camellia lanceoleosa TaxID=1840588 RepID=A0ACC0GDK2_9ERIC|nr:Protein DETOXIFICATION 42 [Camellia lanceoleosa]
MKKFKRWTFQPSLGWKGKNIRKLVKDGFVIRKPTKIHSRSHARRMNEAKRKGRHSGYGCYLVGPVPLAAAGVSISIFNQVSKVTIFPLSLTTSFVAEEDTVGRINREAAEDENLEKISAKNNEMKELKVEDVVLENLEKDLDTNGEMKELMPEEDFKTIITFLQHLLQFFWDGIKDTRTPLYAIVAGDTEYNIGPNSYICVPFGNQRGAAIAHVLSQYLISLILLCKLMTKVDLLTPSVKDLQFNQFFKNGFLLLARVIAVTFCVTLTTSLAARLSTTPMAAFQICLQVWMTSSLLSDGLAIAGQAIIACAFAEKDYEKAKVVAAQVLQGFVLGLVLAVVVGLGLQFGSGIVTKDKNVVHLISICIPFVAAMQPINSLAFAFDGCSGIAQFIKEKYIDENSTTASILDVKEQ